LFAKWGSFRLRRCNFRVRRRTLDFFTSTFTSHHRAPDKSYSTRIGHLLKELDVLRRSGVLGERDCAIFSRRRVRRPTQYPYTSLFKFRLRASDAKNRIPIGPILRKFVNFGGNCITVACDVAHENDAHFRARLVGATSAKETPLESVEY
jgi:hypothetical protein